MSNREALINLLKAVDASASIPDNGGTADIINAIAEAIAAKNAPKKTASKTAAKKD